MCLAFTVYQVVFKVLSMVLVFVLKDLFIYWGGGAEGGEENPKRTPR